MFYTVYRFVPLYSRPRRIIINIKQWKRCGNVLHRVYRVYRFNLQPTMTPLRHRSDTAFTFLNGQNRPFTAHTRIHTRIHHPWGTPLRIHHAGTGRATCRCRLRCKRVLPPWIQALFSFPMREVENAPLNPCTGSMQ